MKTCMWCCVHIECNALNIYENEKCFEQILYRRAKHIFYMQHTFTASRAAFEIIKKGVL
jgi:hypothetical protein